MGGAGNYGASVQNQVPSDPFQQPAVPDAPQPHLPPPVDPTAPLPPYPGNDLPAQQPYAGSDLPPQQPYTSSGPPQSPYASSDLPPESFGAPQPYGHPQPYGPPPAFGQYPGYPPPAPAMLPGTNGFAIGALVASICGGLGIGTALGLAFGITALVQIKRRPQKGRGLAIAALVISGLSLVVTVAALTIAIIDEVRDDAAGIEDVDTTKLKPGDCIRSISESSRIYDMPVMPCDQPHAAEVYHVFTFPSGPYPGQSVVEKESEERCGAAFEPYDTPQNSDLEIYYLYPLSSDWWQDRGVTCIATDPSGTRTTSIVK